MRKLDLLIFMLLTIVTGAKAQTELTSVEALTQNYFVMSANNVSPYCGDAGNQAKLILTSQLKGSSKYYRMKAEAIMDYGDDKTHYRVIIVNESNQPMSDNDKYLNSAGYVWYAGNSELSGQNHKYGQDADGLGLVDINYKAGKGFSFKRIVTNGGNDYIGVKLDHAATETFWTCYDASTLTAATATTEAKTYTDLSDLTSNTFMLVNPDGQAAYFKDGSNDLQFGLPESVAKGSDYHLFQAQKVLTDNGTDYYRIGFYTSSGIVNEINGGWFLNVQPSHTGVVFSGSAFEGYNNGYGTDLANGGLWSIEKSGDGFAFKSKANGTYLGTTTSNQSETAVVYNCVTPTTYTNTSTEEGNFTSVDELTTNFFTLETNGKSLCHTAEGNQNSRSYTTSEVIASYPDHLFKAEKVADGQYLIMCYSINGNSVDCWLGKYLNLQPGGGVLFFGNGEASRQVEVNGVTVTRVYGTDGDNLALWNITYKDGGFVFQNVGNSKYMGDTNASDNEVVFTCKNRYSDLTYSRTVDANDFVTLCLPYAATVTGATVYTVSGVDSKVKPSKTYIEEVADGKTTAGKAYILKTTGTTITAALDADNTVSSPVTTDALVGTFISTKATDGTYVLNNQWLKVVADAEPTVGANRAWLNLTNASEVSESTTQAKSFISFVDDSVTAINGVQKVQKNDNAIYNLSGQRVSNPTHGIYIRNGKKFIIR